MPAYAKCVRMLGGLNDKEINETYVKVNSSFYYLTVAFSISVFTCCDLEYRSAQLC